MEHFTSVLALFLSVLLFSYLLARKLQFPVIPVYILAGIATSTLLHVNDVHIFETLGVILLLFFIGLEFSVAELERNFRSIISVGTVDFLINTVPAFLAARFLGFDTFNAFVVATILYPSSSAIVSKLLIDLKKLANPEVETVLAILVFEDIAAAVLLAVLTNFSTGEFTPTNTLQVLLKIFLFILIAFLAIKNLNKLVDSAFNKAGTSTEFTVLFIGSLLFLIIEATFGFGLSESIGAFIAGMLFAESSFKEHVESVVIPFRDLFGALFFLSFGLTIDIKTFSSLSITILSVLVTVSFLTKIVTGLITVRFYNLGIKSGLSAGLMLLPRGEFSILVAGVVPKLISLTAAYVLVSSIAGSYAVKESGKIIGLFFKKKERKKSRLTRSQLMGD